MPNIINITFMPRFVKPIRNDEKDHTMRRGTKGAQADDTLHMWTGREYNARGEVVKQGTLFAKAVVVRTGGCYVGEDACSITTKAGWTRHLTNEYQRNEFARADGLADFAELKELLTRFYGPLPFRGAIIHYKVFERPELPSVPEQLELGI
jgi:hypothetical protein